MRSFRLILDSWFAGQRFLCRIPVNNRPKNEAFVLDAGCRFWWQFLSKTNITNLASFDSLSQNLPLERAWTRKLEWNNTKRKRHFAHLSGKKRFVALALKCWKGWHFRTWVCLVQSQFCWLNLNVVWPNHQTSSVSLFLQSAVNYLFSSLFISFI